LGVGEDVAAEYASARSAYRDGPAPLRLSHGDLHFARRTLGQTMALEWAMLVATVWGCALAVS
jgi:hypothetical protein